MQPPPAPLTTPKLCHKPQFLPGSFVVRNKKEFRYFIFKHATFRWKPPPWGGNVSFLRLTF